MSPEGEWKEEGLLEGQLAEIVGEWVGMVDHAEFVPLPPPPGTTEPLLVLVLTIRPREEGAEPVEQRSLFTRKGAAVLASKMLAYLEPEQEK